MSVVVELERINDAKAECHDLLAQLHPEQGFGNREAKLLALWRAALEKHRDELKQMVGKRTSP